LHGHADIAPGSRRNGRLRLSPNSRRYFRSSSTDARPRPAPDFTARVITIRLSRVKPNIVPGIRELDAPAVDFYDIQNSIPDFERIDKVEPDANTKLTLFVYGSLIDPIHRAEVLGHFADGVPAILHDYARGRSLHWYIRRRPGTQTEGLVLTNLDARDLATLRMRRCRRSIPASKSG